MNRLVEKILFIENKLNKVYGKKLPLGSFLILYLRDIKRGRTQIHTTETLIVMLRSLGFLFKFLLNWNYERISKEEKHLILGKTGEKNHLNKLVDYIEDDYRRFAHPFDQSYKRYYSSLSFFERLRVIFSTIKVIYTNYRLLKKILKDNDIFFSSTLLVNELVIHCIRFFTLINVISDWKSLELIIVDYDRDKFIPLILAANSLDVKTVSLQHGAINPPYGYNPILANEIWVWGKLWKETLIKMGVAPEQIRVVGSTIVDAIEVKGKKSNNLKVVGIGPNPIGELENLQLWKELIEELINCGLKITVKLHPSMRRENSIYNIFGETADIYESGEITNQDFFEKIDMLIVSNSGLGYEAVLSSLLVAVVMQNKESIGNDYLMIERGKFPKIHLSENLLEKINFISSNYNRILQQEIDFVNEEIYDSIGNQAKVKIKKLINIELDYEMGKE